MTVTNEMYIKLEEFYESSVCDTGEYLRHDIEMLEPKAGNSLMTLADNWQRREALKYTAWSQIKAMAEVEGLDWADVAAYCHESFDAGDHILLGRPPLNLIADNFGKQHDNKA